MLSLQQGTMSLCLSALSNMLIPTLSHLAKDILSTFLFPGLSDPNTAGCQPRLPVLKDAVREDLYHLVLSLSKTQEDLGDIVDHFEDLVPRGEYSKQS